MLNTKYLKFGDSEREVRKNTYALGNVWFVSNIEDVENADEEIAKLGEINTAITAVVNKKEFGLTADISGKDSLASIQLISNEPRKLQYESNSSKDAFAVFSEIYYPKGWVAKIDGKEVPIIRANYTLRALQVPAGKHTIDFEFNPESYITGYTITNISSYLFALIVFGGFGFAIFKSVKKGADTDDNNDQEKDIKKEPRQENAKSTTTKPSSKTRNKQRKR